MTAKRPPVLHPFLFALFPILALYAYNIKSIPIAPAEVLVPLLSAGLGTGLLFVILRTATKAPLKAGAAVSVVVLWLLSFGHLARWIAAWTEGLFERSLFYATALLVALAVFGIFRTRRDLGGATRVLNVVALVLVVWNLASAAQTLAKRSPIRRGESITGTKAARTKPNIYYIVLDAYARADVLAEVFSFDNSPFLAALRARGFVIADRSYANYSQTYQSLASSLNFVLLDGLANEAGPSSRDRRPLYEMIRNNAVMAFLKSQGYRLITVSSSLDPTDLKGTDRYFGFAASRSEFRSVLLATTPWPLFFAQAARVSSYEAHRGRILNAFKALEGSPAEKGPFFMFVHIMAPHPPFVFGARGEPVNPDYLFNMVDADRLHGLRDSDMTAYMAGYRNQLTFLNIKILEAVDAIRAASPQPPIIILQGDHGSRAYMDFDRPEASYFKENLAILNAYDLPGTERDEIYPGISPVNTFRLIFRTYFGTGLDPLPDRSSWSTWGRPYRFLPFAEGDPAGTLGSVRQRIKPKTPIVQR